MRRKMDDRRHQPFENPMQQNVGHYMQRAVVQLDAASNDQSGVVNEESLADASEQIKLQREIDDGVDAPTIEGGEAWTTTLCDLRVFVIRQCCCMKNKEPFGNMGCRRCLTTDLYEYMYIYVYIYIYMRG